VDWGVFSDVKLPLFTKYFYLLPHKNRYIIKNNYPLCRSLIAIIDWQNYLPLTGERLFVVYLLPIYFLFVPYLLPISFAFVS